MTKYACAICGKTIRDCDAVVRIAVEVVQKKGGDEDDLERWSRVIDWDMPFKAHLDCVATSVGQGIRFQYDDLCTEVPVEELNEEILAQKPKLVSV